MCGIAGLFGYLETSPPVDRNSLDRMTKAMIPRGPDGAGTWISAENGVGFGHRRLSIIDLSEGGAQPMVLDGNRLSITYNGEYIISVRCAQNWNARAPSSYPVPIPRSCCTSTIATARPWWKNCAECSPRDI